MAFKIIRNDITKVAADVIVNSANPKPVCGGSTEAIIYEAAGYDELLDARQGVGYLEVGQVGVTPAFNLPAKSIVHVSCPRWNDGAAESVEMLRQCYVSILQQAVALEAKSIAVPLLSSGVYRFPKEVALQIAAEICGNFSAAEMEILLVVYDLEAFKKAQELFGNVEDLLKEDVLAEEEFVLRSPRVSILDDENLPPCSKPTRVCKASSLLPSEAPRVPGKRSDSCSKPVSDIFGGFAKPKVIKSKAKSIHDQDTAMADIDRLLKNMNDDSFQDVLHGYMERANITPVQLYTDSNLNRKHFSKIKKDGYRPSKNTALALAVGLQLNLDETEDLLSRAGHALSPISKTDVIFRYCLRQKDFYKPGRIKPIYRMNDYLEAYGEDVLGIDDEKQQKKSQEAEVSG